MAADDLDIDSLIKRLLEVRGCRPGKTVQMTEGEVKTLCHRAREIFLSQPILLELEAPLKICGMEMGTWLYILVRGCRPGKTVQMTEGEVKTLCHRAREIFLSQPILLELEAPLKICGMEMGTWLYILVRGCRPGKTVQMTEGEVKTLCHRAREIFLSQPILLELEAPLKICGMEMGTWLYILVRGCRPGKTVQMTEGEVKTLCHRAREIFLSQPILLELEAPLKICGMEMGTWLYILVRGCRPGKTVQMTEGEVKTLCHRAREIFLSQPILLELEAPLKICGMEMGTWLYILVRGCRPGKTVQMTEGEVKTLCHRAREIFLSQPILLELEAPLKICGMEMGTWLYILVRGCRPGKTVQMTEGEVKTLCHRAREIFLSQPILLELEAPLKICGMEMGTWLYILVRGCRPGKTVQMTEGEVKTLCHRAREIFLSQPILLELEAPLKICGMEMGTWLYILVRGCRPGKTVQMTEGEVKTLCHRAREIFLSQPILLELEAPLKICGMEMGTWLYILVRGCRPGKTVQMTEGEVKTLCHRAREIFLSQPILLELEAPLKICGMEMGTWLYISVLDTILRSVLDA